MFKLNKIIYILMITIMLLANVLPFLAQNTSKAVTLPKEKINLISKGTITRFKYDGEPFLMQYICYKKNGEDFPAYGLDRTKPSITFDKGYSVSIDSLETNQRVWRALVNGYPFKTLEELNCDRNAAYVATKIAVYDAFYNYDLTKITEVEDNEYSKDTVKLIKELIELERNSSQTKIVASLKITEENTKWKVDSINNNYISKTYTVTASAPNENYEVKITGENINNIKLTDTNNSPKSVFLSEEKFKILIPISDLKSSGEFYINVKSSLETYPIFHAKPLENDYEDFVITMDKYEDTETTYKQTYEANKTKIKILKRDGESESPLEGAVFNLLDQNKDIIYSDLKTNKEGIIEISYLMPGAYYLEEVISPSGYYGYEELIPVNLEYQDEKEIIVDNFREEGEKQVPNEPIQEHYTPTKKLPVTGC